MNKRYWLCASCNKAVPLGPVMDLILLADEHMHKGEHQQHIGSFVDHDFLYPQQQELADKISA